MSNADYKPIPATDLEVGDASTTGGQAQQEDDDSASYSPPQLSPQEKYPQANEQQAGLLMLLDDAIVNVVPHFEPPLLTIEPPLRALVKEFPSMAHALKIPAATLAATITGAFAIIAVDDPLLIALYPFIAAFLSFLSTLPPLIGRFVVTGNIIMDLLDESIQKIKSKIDDICTIATGYVDEVEDKIQEVVAPMKPILDKASKAEVALKRIDPEIEIPDTKDLEDALGGVGDDIEHKMAELQQSSLDLEACIPKIFQSDRFFRRRVIFPMIVVILLIQVLIVYAQQGGLLDAIEEATSDDDDSQSENDEDGSYSDKLADSWDLFLAAILAFVTAAAQLILSFVISQKWIGKSYVNIRILLASAGVSTMMEEKVEPLFRDLLLVKMENIKAQIVKLIESMAKIDVVMKQVNSVSFFS